MIAQPLRRPEAHVQLWKRLRKVLKGILEEASSPYCTDIWGVSRSKDRSMFSVEIASPFDSTGLTLEIGMQAVSQERGILYIEARDLPTDETLKYFCPIINAEESFRYDDAVSVDQRIALLRDAAESFKPLLEQYDAMVKQTKVYRKSAMERVNIIPDIKGGRIIIDSFSFITTKEFLHHIESFLTIEGFEEEGRA